MRNADWLARIMAFATLAIMLGFGYLIITNLPNVTALFNTGITGLTGLTKVIQGRA